VSVQAGDASFGKARRLLNANDYSRVFDGSEARASHKHLLLLAITNNTVPPTINHFTDDDQIDSKLNFTFNKPQRRTVNVAMSNTFGFGGHNACVLFKKLD